MTTKAIRTVTHAYLDAYKTYLHEAQHRMLNDGKNFSLREHSKRHHVVRDMVRAIKHIKTINLRNLKLKKTLGIRK